MLIKGKRLIIIIFGVLLLDDICKIIKSAIEYGGLNYEIYGFLYSIINGHVVVHLAFIYMLVVLIFYFGINFFKNE